MIFIIGLYNNNNNYNIYDNNNDDEIKFKVIYFMYMNFNLLFFNDYYNKIYHENVVFKKAHGKAYRYTVYRLNEVNNLQLYLS